MDTSALLAGEVGECRHRNDFKKGDNTNKYTAVIQHVTMENSLSHPVIYGHHVFFLSVLSIFLARNEEENNANVLQLCCSFHQV